MPQRLSASQEPGWREPGEPDPLSRVRRRARQRLGQQQGALVGALGDAVYRRATAETLQGLAEDPDGVVDFLAHAVEVMDDRPPGELALRVGERDATTVVEIAADDAPFLVSTVLEELRHAGEEVTEVVHPVVGVERDAHGRLARLGSARDAPARESFIWLRLGRRLADAERDHLRDRLSRVLGDARAATADFAAMTARAETVAAELRRRGPLRWDPGDVEEVAALLEWLLDDHFVWLGARDYRLVDTGDGPGLVVDADSGLGVVRDPAGSSFAEPVPLTSLPPEAAMGFNTEQPLTVSRTNRPSTVHKRVRMISLSITALNDRGEPAAERRFLGLFAQRAYAEPASTTPVLRRKLEAILTAEDVVGHSHDERALRTLFEALPKHELFAVDTEQLRATIVELLEAQRRQDVALWCHAESAGRGIVAVLTLPRERFNAGLRQRVQQVLAEHFGAEEIDYHLSLAEGEAALLYFLLHVDPRAIERVDLDAVERRVVEMASTWDDAVAGELHRSVGSQEQAQRLAERYRGAFDEAYQAATGPGEAVTDIAALEAVRTGDDPVTLRLVATGDPRTPLRARLVKRGAEVELSAFVPILESLGFVVVEQVPHRLTVEGAALQLHDFGVRTPVGRTVDVAADHTRLAEAVGAIWHERAEADLLNRLVIDAGMTWSDVAVLRAYRRYRRQVGTAYTETYQDEALLAYPDVAEALVGLFRVRVDPRVDGSEAALQHARAALQTALHEIAQLDQDRILRRIAGTVEATVRSNVAVPVGAERGSEALAIKLDSRQVPDAAAPVPYAEVFVHHPGMEGIHVRGGRVARGGVRASDRREDFREEVLNLMQAQMTKNAVIVPTGAKGGFVLRGPLADPDERAQATTAAYRRYIRALLDVTDDVEGDGTVPAANVRRRDGDDPYLVVAPDKGTAALSTEANAISHAYGFWLGDAFATGGSSGFDHKQLGVTARGAWVAIQRHFRELGVDVQHEPIRVAGIGDMGGDVFGNGMLQSSRIKLVAAFDHRDIFVDPDADPETSYAERQRLFAAARSSWQHYDRGRLGPGGGVWSRQAKSVAVSEQVRQLLGVDWPSATPPALIRAILQAPVDLLFLGGIGTFVKASHERHDQVSDRANDAVRVDAAEVRARVVGEGANLGVTQGARIEYARRGGRINTDAVDNAGGVDTSDREVNLKLAVDAAIADGELDPGERDELLAATTEPVVERVLADVGRQAAAISHERVTSAQDLSAHVELLERLEGHGESPAPAGRLDRELEMLPDQAELGIRADAGAGLTRPEIAVLMGYAKLDLRTALLDSSLPDDPALETLLTGYFPDAAVRAMPEAIAAHPLRRELIATRVTGDVVDCMGVTWVDRVVRQSGAPACHVVAAYWVARTLLDAPSAWEIVARHELACDPLLTAELRALVTAALDQVARTELRFGVEAIGEVIERDRGAVEAIASATGELGSQRFQRRRERIARYVDLGLPRADAEHLVGLADFAIAPDVAAISRRLDRLPPAVADVHRHVNDALPFARVAEQLELVEPRGLWQRWQRQGLVGELQQARRAVAERVLTEHPDREAPEAVTAFLDARPEARARLERLVARVEAADEVDLDAVAVVVRALRDAFAG
jgi:glutamate dehydrogenase